MYFVIIIYGPGQIKLTQDEKEKILRAIYSGYSVMPLTAKQFLRHQLIHHFGNSKVAAYCEAYSCSEEFTLDTAKWLLVSVGPHARPTFCAVGISGTLQLHDSSGSRERQAFAQRH